MNNKLIVDVLGYGGMNYSIDKFEKEFNCIVERYPLGIKQKTGYYPYEVTFNDPNKQIEFILTYGQYIVNSTIS